MKLMRTIIITVAIAAASIVSAAAQWQVPDHAVPIGRGGGTGFKSAVVGPRGTVLRSNGMANDPTFRASYSLMPEDFGAADTLNPAVDDAPFVQAAVDRIQFLGGGGLYLRRCYNLLSGPIVIIDTSIEISGPNSDTGCLQVRNATGGIQFTATTAVAPDGSRHSLNAHDFSVVAMNSGSSTISRGTCIRASWPVSPDQLNRMYVQNVVCRSETFNAGTNNAHFDNGLHVSQADGFYADNFNWYQIGNTTGRGIWIDNSTLPSSYGYNIVNYNANGGVAGIDITGCVESVKIISPIILATRGINADSSTCTNAPVIGHNVEFQLSGGHINSTGSAINIVDWTIVNISAGDYGNFFGGLPVTENTINIQNAFGVTISNNHVGSNGLDSGVAIIRVADVAHCVISGNVLQAVPDVGNYAILSSSSTASFVPGCAITGNTIAGTAVGIDISNSYENTVSGNTVRAASIGITGSATNSRVEGNTISAGTPNPYSLAGGTTLISQQIAGGPSSFLSANVYTFAGGANGFQWNNQANTVAAASLNGVGNFEVASSVRAPTFFLPGSSSGQVGLTAQAVAGTPTLTFPNTSGTFAVSASSPLVLNATTGALTCPTCATTAGSSIPTVAQGDLLYGSGANTLSALAKDTNDTRYLSNTGSSNNPAWAQINLANGVTGTLLVGSGGTGATTLTGILRGNGTSAFTAVTGTNGNVPIWNSNTFAASAIYATSTEAVIGGSTTVAGRTLTLFNADQATFAFQTSVGSAGNNMLGIVYDPGVLLSDPGFAIQNLDDTGSFVSLGAVWWRDGSITIGGVDKAAAGSIKVQGYAAGSLPTCNGTSVGSRLYVTDATATTFASVVAGGGANVVPVFCNGSNWIIGANDNVPLRKVA